jgi:hypothetical protein
VREGGELVGPEPTPSPRGSVFFNDAMRGGLYLGRRGWSKLGWRWWGHDIDLRTRGAGLGLKIEKGAVRAWFSQTTCTEACILVEGT